jgi:glyoxylase-like metal-dependent hydrolase (beta-lactamase superfamily II)
MASPTHVQLRLIDTGYCTVSEHQVLRGAPRRRLLARALVAVLHHPLFGVLLFDTGYAPRFFTATRHWPERFYAQLTPVTLASRSLIEQLLALGIAASDVRYVILSHLHADHIAGVLDFPAAELIIARSAIDDITGRNRIQALLRGYLGALLPQSALAQVRAVSGFVDAPLPLFGPTCDLFGDGSLRLVALPGHARGQIGLLVACHGGPVFLVADGAWHSRAIRDNIPPDPSTAFFADDYRQTVATVAQLHELSRLHPEMRLWPTHCPELTQGFDAWV